MRARRWALGATGANLSESARLKSVGCLATSFGPRPHLPDNRATATYKSGNPIQPCKREACLRQTGLPLLALVHSSEHVPHLRLDTGVGPRNLSPRNGRRPLAHGEAVGTADKPLTRGTPAGATSSSPKGDIHHESRMPPLPGLGRVFHFDLLPTASPWAKRCRPLRGLCRRHPRCPAKDVGNGQPKGRG